MTRFRESTRQRAPSRDDAECHDTLRARRWALLLASCVLTDVAHSDAAIATETLPDPLAAGWRGQPVCVKLHETTEVRVLRCTFPPGVGHERHFHPRHFGYALAGGTMEILDQNGTRRVDIAAGSYFSSEGIDWHEGLNVGDTVVQYLMIEPR
jgi:quercetin dioxygenase-like cupin family protein